MAGLVQRQRGMQHRRALGEVELEGIGLRVHHCRQARIGQRRAGRARELERSGQPPAPLQVAGQPPFQLQSQPVPAQRRNVGGAHREPGTHAAGVIVGKLEPHRLELHARPLHAACRQRDRRDGLSRRRETAQTGTKNEDGP